MPRTALPSAALLAPLLVLAAPSHADVAQREGLNLNSFTQAGPVVPGRTRACWSRFRRAIAGWACGSIPSPRQRTGA
jgi:hypothetical protein